MFTGIVLGQAAIQQIEEKDGGRRLSLRLDPWHQGLELGASVAVNGCCLTAVEIKGELVSFDLIQETLRRTNLGDMQIGDLVNIERAMKLGDEFGGHQVSGHIDCRGKIKSVNNSPNNCDLIIQIGEDENSPSQNPWMKYLIPKGWIAIDGVSLTICDVGVPTGVNTEEKGQQEMGINCFSVSLIPETLKRTTLGNIQPGDAVNLELDATTKVIVQTLERILPDYLERYIDMD